ncbi:hypothetical protein [Thermosporothrix hazakensis]|uniref:hypothetical protein n=1 Tax=Thermosporothrix hazakensis TaxID=644383 RepID=UPI001B881157|nr:hypothetical protein [Thermosporothrix hazakensis]
MVRLEKDSGQSQAALQAALLPRESPDPYTHLELMGISVANQQAEAWNAPDPEACRALKRFYTRPYVRMPVIRRPAEAESVRSGAFP